MVWTGLQGILQWTNTGCKHKMRNGTMGKRRKKRKLGLYLYGLQSIDCQHWHCSSGSTD